MIKKEIEGIDDIKVLINSFYEKVVNDTIIGYYFVEIQKVHWDSHLAVMYSFWDSILFGTSSYKGNPMLKHYYINIKEPFSPTHFNQWLKLWEDTIDEHFIGIIADIAKQRAQNMANGIQRTLKVQ